MVKCTLQGKLGKQEEVRVGLIFLLMVKQTLLSEASAMDINKFFYAVDFLVDAVIRILVDPVTRKITLWKFCGRQSPPSSKKYSL